MPLRIQPNTYLNQNGGQPVVAPIFANVKNNSLTPSSSNVKFFADDCGCYVDGRRGDREANRRVVDIAKSYGFNTKEKNADDAVDSAVDFLNVLCDEGIHFEWVDADLLLILNEVDEDESEDEDDDFMTKANLL